MAAVPKINLFQCLGPRQTPFDFLRRERLLDASRDAHLFGQREEPRTAMGSDEYLGIPGVTLPDSLEELQTVRVGHRAIEEDDDVKGVAVKQDF